MFPWFRRKPSTPGHEPASDIVLQHERFNPNFPANNSRVQPITRSLVHSLDTIPSPKSTRKSSDQADSATPSHHTPKSRPKVENSAGGVTPCKHAAKSKSATKISTATRESYRELQEPQVALPKDIESQQARRPISPSSGMETSRVPSSLNRLSVNLSRGQLKTRQEAKEQEAIIHERLKRAGQPIPPYEFQNYIGKGSYGRVYVARDTRPEGFGRVAIKILEIDTVDFNAHLRDRDQSFEEFLKELKTLQQLKSYGARNVNQIFDVFEVHSQFWVISEYCPGGSVHTLMQATKNRVEEKYIIPIARELAIGLNAVHKANVIHRDVKAANVMIHEEGALQIIDFGVAGMLQNESDKRRTMIGTPHWMAPEVLKPGKEGYGTKVDTWAFGCTLFEMATGAPPRKQYPALQLEPTIKRYGAPTLRPDQGHSQDLCDLVASTFALDPEERPSMEKILEHEYLRNTEDIFPTRSLRYFVQEFQNWAEAGGQRHSLFTHSGAPAASLADSVLSNTEWRFSTLESTEIMEDLDPIIDEQLSDDFINNDHTHASHLDQVADMSSTQAQEDAFNSYDASQPSSPFLTESELTPGGSPTSYDNMTTPTVAAPASGADETQVGRGGKTLGRLFDTDQSHYEYSGLNTQQSDLPLRNSTPESTAIISRKKEVEANVIGSSHSGNIALADPATLKAKRKDRPPTMAWNFPGAATDEASDDSQAFKERQPTMGWKFPEGASDHHADELRAPLPSGISDRSSDTGDLDIGTPGDEAYEDSNVAPYTAPATTNYHPAHHTSHGLGSDIGGTQTSRQPLDLDAYGASFDTDADNEDTKKARQTLDLDALMGDMEIGAASTTSQAAPQSLGYVRPSVEDDVSESDGASDYAASDYGASDYGATESGAENHGADNNENANKGAANKEAANNGAADDEDTDDEPVYPPGTSKYNSVPFMAPGYRMPPKPVPPSAAVMNGTASVEEKASEMRRIFNALHEWQEHMKRKLEYEYAKLEAEERKEKEENAAGGKRGS